MSSTFKTALIAAAVVATFGTVQAAAAGGLYSMPYGTYLPGAFDDDSYCDDCSYGYVTTDPEDAAEAVTDTASRLLGVDVEDVIDSVDE